RERGAARGPGSDGPREARGGEGRGLQDRLLPRRPERELRTLRGDAGRGGQGRDPQGARVEGPGRCHVRAERRGRMPLHDPRDREGRGQPVVPRVRRSGVEGEGPRGDRLHGAASGGPPEMARLRDGLAPRLAVHPSPRARHDPAVGLGLGDREPERLDDLHGVLHDRPRLAGRGLAVPGALGKMSKSRGNTWFIREALRDWPADVIRLTVANAGDGLDDPNVDLDFAETAMDRLQDWVRFATAKHSTRREGHGIDAWFLSILNRTIRATRQQRYSSNRRSRTSARSSR